MISIVSNDQMREMDNKAINDYSIPGIVLMENAGRNTALSIIEICDELAINSAIIIAGKGNNGGDGFVIARYLDKEDIDVVIYLAAKEQDIAGDAAINLEICRKSNILIIEIDAINNIVIPENDFIIIDALLGTGFIGPVKFFYADLINWINNQDCYICSIDIPSGARGDSLKITGPVVKADTTFTMGLPKLSQFFDPVRACTGDLEIIDIGTPAELELIQDIKIRAVFEEDIFLDYPDSSLNKHKAGRVFILGGSVGMTGAVILASKAASIAGAGLVVTAVAESLNSIIENKITEQMSFPLKELMPGIIAPDALEQINEKLNWCDVFLIGPGLGRAEQTELVVLNAIEKALQLNKKIVADADALFFIAKHQHVLKKLNQNCLLTPHHGEFARFNANYKEGLKLNPWDILADFNHRFDCVVNLKGSPSMVGHKDHGIFINTTGNPGLAKGGSGDLLAGLIAGLAATGLAMSDASIYGNYIHGMAADFALEKWGVRSYSMTDLLDELKRVFKNLYDTGI